MSKRKRIPPPKRTILVWSAFDGRVTRRPFPTEPRMSVGDLRSAIESAILDAGLTFFVRKSPYSPSVYYDIRAPWKGDPIGLRVLVVKVSNHAGAGGKCNLHFCSPSNADPFSKAVYPTDELSNYLRHVVATGRMSLYSA